MAGLTNTALSALGTANSIIGVGRSFQSLAGQTGGGRTADDAALLDAVQAADRSFLAADQAEEQARRRLAARTRLETERVQAEAAERRRRDALRRSVARTRAQLGAQGISSADGSGEAILLGLIREAEDDQREAAALDRLRQRALAEEDQAAERRNLLEQARLAERQRLERLARGRG